MATQRSGNGKAPTQHDLAQAAGVSQITVSRVLAEHPSVSESAREKVLQAVAQLGYRHHASAKAMRTGRHDCIGLLTTHEEGYAPQLQHFLWALHARCDRRCLRLLVAQMPESGYDPTQPPGFLQSASVDGLALWYTRPVPAAMRRAITDLDLPVTWLNTDLPGAIRPADAADAERVVALLRDQGHERIAYLATGGTHISTCARRAGYEAAMERAGLASDIIDVDAWQPREDWVAHARAVLERPRRPTAILSYERYPALAIRIASEGLGLRIPEDLSLATFGVSGFVSAGLDFATMRFPAHAMADACIDRLLSPPSRPRQVLVPSDWDPGRTIAPAVKG